MKDGTRARVEGVFWLAVGVALAALAIASIAELADVRRDTHEMQSTFRTQNLIVDDAATFNSPTAPVTFTNGPTGINAYSGVHGQWTDEWFYPAVSTTATPIGTIWATQFSGTGASMTVVNGNGRPGVNGLSTGTTTTGIAALHGQNNAFVLSSTAILFRGVVGYETLSTSSDEYSSVIGDSSANAPSPLTGCFVEYDRGNVATGGPNTGNLNEWECWCKDTFAGGGTTACMMDGTVCDGTTTVAQPVAAVTWPSTNVYDIEIKSVGIPPTEVDFYVNNVESCVIKHNLPTTGIFNDVSMVKSAGTNARIIDIDYTDQETNLSAPRSP